MANWNYTRVKCSDPERFAEILKNNPFTGPHSSRRYEDAPVTIGDDGWAEIQSRNSLPLEIIQNLSAGTDLTFTAEFSLEGDWHAVTHVVEFKNGEGNEIEERINYSRMSTGSDVHGPVYQELGERYVKLMTRAEELFRRMDTTVKDGRDVISIIPEDVQLTVRDDEYALVLQKNGCYIEILRVLKKKAFTTYTWVEYPENSPTKSSTADSLPF